MNGKRWPVGMKAMQFGWETLLKAFLALEELRINNLSCFLQYLAH